MPGTVTVACKIPMGLHLDLPNKKRATVRGPAMEVGFTTQGREPPIVANSYALTYDVDADHWDEWLKLNGNLEIVQKKFVFASAKTPDARAIAREHEKELTKMEPLNADAPGQGLERIGVA